MLSHLEHQGILDADQHGFRKDLSTEIQLIQAVHDWANNINHGGQTESLSLDFSNVCDAVPHGCLLNKLKHKGVSGKTNDWLSNLLQGRRQQVIVIGARPDWSPVPSGVPQGIVSLFNDISVGISSKMPLFADDRIIYRRFKSIDDHQA